MPAALALQHTPPSPLGRSLLWIIVLLFSSALVWSAAAEVDIVAKASGKLIPAGHSSTVQAGIAGSIDTIHIRDGQQVVAGQLLIELDSVAATADIELLEARYQQTAAALWRTGVLLDALSTPAPTRLTLNDGPASTDATLAAAEVQLARQQFASLKTAFDEHQQQRNLTRLQRNTLQLEIEKLRALLPLISERAESHRRLAAQSHVSKDSWYSHEQRRIEVTHELNAALDRDSQLQAAIDSAQAAIDAFLASRREQIQLEHHQLRSRQLELRQQLTKAAITRELHQITAPIAGRVQQLVNPASGNVIHAAQPLLTLVPADAQLLVSARLQNSDIAFVSEGQPATIKLDAYPFTRYGALQAVVTSLSTDAIESPQGWLYDLTLSLQQQQLPASGNPLLLTAGMTATVEIKTGSRRVLDFLLSPLLRYRDESARER